MKTQMVRAAFVSWVWCVFLSYAWLADAQEASRPSRGIAVLASSIGTAYSVEALAGLVEKGRFSPVVVDWAWITMHWDHTNFGAVNQLVSALSRKGVEVVAMYRPRFIGQATVPVQVTSDGKPLTSEGHSEICYSSVESRRWGLGWGDKILEKCPGFTEIVIYNLQDHCECPKCAQARKGGQYSPVLGFLSEARTAWRRQKPEIKLGLTFPLVADFWRQTKGIIDVAHPMLAVRQETDFPREAAEVRVIGNILGPKLRSCLAKVTWGENDKVSQDKLATFDQVARTYNLAYFLWTFDTLFLSQLYDLRAVCTALQLEYASLEPALASLGREAVVGPDEARAIVNEAAETHVYGSFDRLEHCSDAAVREMIRMLEDRNLFVVNRYSAAIALGITHSRLAGPALLKALHDPMDTVRRCAADSLPKCSDDMDQVRRALTEVARNDPFEYLDPATGKSRFLVRESAQRALAALPVQSVSFAEAVSGKRVTIVAIKDFLRMENTGAALQNVEFKRYFPVVDQEQVAVARWVEARSDGGETIPVSIVKVSPDEQRNLIHTYRLSRFPEKPQVLVTVTSLVARRERPAPKGEFPIPAPEAYPSNIRPFLSRTPMVPSDHPDIQRQADKILSRTRDAYGVARELARLMKTKSLTPVSDSDQALPVALIVLRYGGTCCGSAVFAAAVLRACGIPAQVTYCPAGYIHGIVRFYLNGYGWVRMDSTCGVGKLPLLHTEEDLGLARLFDMPVEMEAIPYAYGWPYSQNEERGQYQFRSGGRICDSVRFAHKATSNPHETPGTVAEPFPHLEPGSWNRVLGSEHNDGAWQDWDALLKASRAAVAKGTMGPFPAVTSRVPALGKYMDRLSELGK